VRPLDRQTLAVALSRNAWLGNQRHLVCSFGVAPSAVVAVLKRPSAEPEAAYREIP
jgi:hypothetical protein